MSYGNLSREELGEQLRQTQENEHRQEHVLHELQIHQVELELQNRELRDAQNALEASRNRYAALYDFAPFAYITFDAHGCIQELNLTAASLLGRDRVQLVGLPFLSLVQMPDSTQFWSHLRRASQAKSRVISELSFSTPTAGLMHVVATSEAVLDDAGQPAGLRTAFSDVSERKKAEAERARAWESEQATREQLERLNYAMLVVSRALADLMSSGQLQPFLQTIVDQAREVIGADYAAFGAWMEGQARPKTAWAFSGLDESAIGAFRGTLAQPGTPFTLPAPLRLDDARKHPHFQHLPEGAVLTNYLGVPVRYGGQVVGHLAVANKQGAAGFSERDEKSAQMLAERVGVAMEIKRLSDVAKNAIASRDALLAIVSHDLRNMLSVVSLRSALLVRNRPENERRQSGGSAEIIRASVEKMGRLIQDLLQASTIESGHFTIDARSEDPEAILKEAVDLIGPQVAEKHLVLEQKVAPALPQVLADRDRVLQVLANLLGNALKFTPPGGHLRLEAEPLGDMVRFTLVDSGCGIPPDELPNLFERFWKGRATGTQGTGLGLFIAKGIVEAHGGRLSVESTVGRGTTFRFTLPVSHEAISTLTPPPQRPDGARLKGLKVLVVDDEVNAATALADLLVDEGLVPSVATTGEEGLELARAQPPDAVVLDVEMPGMGGLSMLQELRRTWPTLPAVIMSGYSEEHAGIKDALVGQAVAYVAKPVSLDDVLVSLGQFFPARP